MLAKAGIQFVLCVAPGSPAFAATSGVGYQISRLSVAIASAIAASRTASRPIAP